jgi:hypothetical protein
MLILLVDPVEYRHFDWIRKLHGMLEDLNVALIFLTKDPLVTARFNAAVNRNEYTGCSVQIDALSMENGRELLRHRIGRFRTGTAPHDLPELTPYEEAAVRWIFTGGKESRTIKIVLNLCRVAMNLRLAKNVTGNAAIPAKAGTGPAVISEDDLRDAYQNSLHQASWGGRK